LNANEREIICVVCAKGCRSVVWEEAGEVHVRGPLCRNGQAYVRREFSDPRRVLTTTLRIDGSGSGRFPVRTRGPVPKDRLAECIHAAHKIRVKAPLRIGEVIIANLLGTGEDLVACSPLPEISGDKNLEFNKKATIL